MISLDEGKTLYLPPLLEDLWKHQTWYSGEIGLGAPFCQLICALDHVVTWCQMTVKNITSPLSQHLQASSLAQWWLMLTGSPLPSHMSIWSCGHMISRYKLKTYLQCHKTYKQETCYDVGSGGGAPTFQVICPFVMWSRDIIDKMKTYLHFHKMFL